MKTNVHLKDFQPRYEGRCPTCFMRAEICICAAIPLIRNKIPLTVIMHYKEAYKTTNTARLAHLCLENSEVILRGLPQKTIDFREIVQPDEELLFLTLSPEAEILNADWVLRFQNQTQKRPRLIVPDGTWSQAARIGKREPALKNVRKIQLPLGNISRYRLRHEHLEEGLSTLEAIARTYGLLEGTEIQSQLETIFEVMVNKTLETRPSNRSGTRPTNR